MLQYIYGLFWNWVNAKRDWSQSPDTVPMGRSVILDHINKVIEPCNRDGMCKWQPLWEWQMDRWREHASATSRERKVHNQTVTCNICKVSWSVFLGKSSRLNFAVTTLLIIYVHTNIPSEGEQWRVAWCHSQNTRTGVTRRSKERKGTRLS